MGDQVNRGDVFRDAPNCRGLDRELKVLTFIRGSVMCHELGSALYPQIPLARLVDAQYFERVDVDAEREAIA